MASSQSILVIDDEQEVGQFVADAAQAMGIQSLSTTDPAKFLEAITPEITLLFLDLVMPEIDGIELLRILAQKGCRANIVLMSGVDKRVMEAAEQWATTLGLSVVAYLHKPFRLKELEVLLEAQLVLRTPTVSEKKPAVFAPEELQRAIDQDEFVLHFQPQIEIKTSIVIGVEALVRWQHPDRGLIFPDDFISHAEQHNLIDKLGWIVVNRGLADIEKFADADGRSPMLSINVSAYSLHDLKFPDTVLKLLKQYDISAENLIFEITESGLIQELSSTLDVLTRLRMKRVNLSIDDFGTGYSMMRQLRRIPATELKIDKGFVQNMLHSDSDRVMVQKTIEIGHDLGMKVVGEGVEIPEQLEFLRNHGCDIAQGYLFSRPLSTPALVTWLKDYRSKMPPPRDHASSSDRIVN